MSTPIPAKLAALGLALMINVTMIGAIAYLFNGQLHGLAVPSLAERRAGYHAPTV